MAVSKSFFGIRRKSTKSHTYQTDAYGQQVTKDRVTEVKNPRSVAQMEQRMLMATASAGYAAMKQIVDHSFEGITYGAPTMAKFTQQNLGKLRKTYYDGGGAFELNPYRDRSLHPGEYIVSDGSLDAIYVPQTNIGSSSSVAQVVFSVNQNNIEALLQVGNDPYNTKIFAEKFGIKVGDCVTVLMIAPLVAGGYTFAFGRLKLLKIDTTAITAANLSEYINFETNCGATLAWDSTVSNFKVVFPTTIKAEYLTSGDDSYVKACKGAIKSVKENGVWKRSKCVLDGSGLISSFVSDDEVLATYPLGQNYVLNGGV